jgi:hypothetical protein
MMDKTKRYLGQVLLYGLFFVPLVYITNSPPYSHQQADMATLKVAVRHAGKVVGECTRLSSEQYANLPANMKRPEVCPRERSSLRLQLQLDDDTLYAETVPASGLHSDGVSSIYLRFSVPAGQHRLRLAMNDDVAVEGNTWQLDRDINLAERQVVVVGFKEGFTIK